MGFPQGLAVIPCASVGVYDYLFHYAAATGAAGVLVSVMTRTETVISLELGHGVEQQRG